MVKAILSSIKSLAGRLAFFVALIVLLPLAVLNRQIVELSLNPLDIVSADPGLSVKIPLFMALFAMFAIGLLLGYGLAGGRRHQKPPRNGKAKPPAMSTASGEGFTKMLKAAQEKPTGSDRQRLEPPQHTE